MTTATTATATLAPHDGDVSHEGHLPLSLAGFAPSQGVGSCFLLQILL